MTICDQMHDKRIEVEDQICKLLAELEEQTGLYCHKVRIIRTQGNSEELEVELDVRTKPHCMDLVDYIEAVEDGC